MLRNAWRTWLNPRGDDPGDATATGDLPQPSVAAHGDSRQPPVRQEPADELVTELQPPAEEPVTQPQQEPDDAGVLQQGDAMEALVHAPLEALVRAPPGLLANPGVQHSFEPLQCGELTLSVVPWQSGWSLQTMGSFQNYFSNMNIQDPSWILVGAHKHSHKYGTNFLQNFVMDSVTKTCAKDMATVIQNHMKQHEQALATSGDTHVLKVMLEFCMHVDANQFPVQPFVAWNWIRGRNCIVSHDMEVDATAVFEFTADAVAMIKRALENLGLLAPLSNFTIKGRMQSETNRLLAAQYFSDLKFPQPGNVCMYTGNKDRMDNDTLLEKTMHSIESLWCDAMWFPEDFKEPRDKTAYDDFRLFGKRRPQSGTCFFLENNWSHIIVIDCVLPNHIAKKKPAEFKDFNLKAMIATTAVISGNLKVTGTFRYVYQGPDWGEAGAIFRLGEYVVKQVLMTKPADVCSSQLHYVGVFIVSCNSHFE